MAPSAEAGSLGLDGIQQRRTLVLLFLAGSCRAAACTDLERRARLDVFYSFKEYCKAYVIACRCMVRLRPFVFYGSSNRGGLMPCARAGARGGARGDVRISHYVRP